MILFFYSKSTKLTIMGGIHSETLDCLSSLESAVLVFSKGIGVLQKGLGASMNSACNLLRLNQVTNHKHNHECDQLTADPLND